MIGQILVVIGVCGIIVSTALEIKTRKKLYEIMMKVFPTIFAVGAIIWGFS